jgi:hypothetical protein
LRAEFKRLIALRHAHPVLRRGSLAAPLLADETTLVLLRRLGDTWAVTAVHNGLAPRRVTVQLPSDAPRTGCVDALAGHAVGAGAAGGAATSGSAAGGTAAAQQADGTLSIDLPALGGAFRLRP